MIFGDSPALDWQELFGNDRPVEVEIGSGKGSFLVAYARSHPQTNLLGLERQWRWVRRVKERLECQAIPNARIVWADAALVVSRFVRDQSVAAFHLYFPDPWWKRRHHKRRLIRGELTADLFRALAPGGALYLSTDVGDRFDDMLAELSSAPFAVETGDAHRAGMPLTNFERKYAAEKRPVYYARLVKPVP